MNRLCSLLLGCCMIAGAIGLPATPARAGEFDTLHEVIRHFQVAFVDRANMSALLLGALEGLQQAAPKAEVRLRTQPELFRVTAGGRSVVISRKVLRSYPELEKALSAAAHLVVSKKLVKSKTALEQSMVRQMVAHCGDPWSVFLQAKFFARLLDDGSGKTGSVGLLVEPWGDGLRVLDVVAGTPADKAGIQVGASVDRIGLRSAGSLNELEALALMRGPIGETVKVVVGGKTYDLTMVEEPKRNISVTPLADGIAHVRIMNFRAGTGRRMAATMDKLEQHYGGKLRGLVLDLRGNPGGLVTEGTEVVGLFIPAGKVVSVVSKKHMRVEVEENPRPGPYRDLPLVLLIDHRTASVSEIITMALRDYDRAKLVGQKTLGKGTVQVVMELMDGSALKLSTGRYYSPKGTPIYSGIEPDVEVAWDGQGKDKQLEKAIKLLQK